MQGDPRLTNIIAEIVFRSGFSVGAGVMLKIPLQLTLLPQIYGIPKMMVLVIKADLNLYGAKIELNKSAGATMINPWKDEIEVDDILPEKFSISLQKRRQSFFRWVLHSF